MGSKQEVSRRATISVDTLRVGDTLHSQALGTQPVAGIRSTTYEVFVEFADGSAIAYRHGADVEIEIDRNITDAHRDQEPKAEPDETDAASYVETSARGLIGDLRELVAMANGESGPTDHAKALGVEAASDEPFALEDEAQERLYEMSLAVEATTTFEVVLGVDGPTRVLCFECVRCGTRLDGQPDYELRRVFYRYSWEGVADVELDGEDLEVAEAFGRRVVPELGE